MNNIVIGLVLSAASFGVLANNGTGGFISNDGSVVQKGGFVATNQAVTTVIQAKELPDDAWVSLEGNIVKQIGKELYEFKDSTGSIAVDIDDRRWRGQVVTPETKVRLDGEIDKEWSSLEVDVKRVTIIKK
ncbi:YgiW/YdeI family stress tolerance OB fold protein [Moellerella wisconsensis]|uniref:YgiW family protein n=1 Tax=Moellerella wisconsensis ATCC 35017 TaxID=1354267 RepID=A0A0N0I9W2_9GAMM|nr:YgiW/YdeI family stress tolerance OB fold protein [Moellerella wisconsensis]KPD02523.1 YgiW family protein [Moellerella wisconsensis ATCC 35017]